MTGHVYAVTSGKGGVGKTTTTAALGTTLAATGVDVAVVDADLGMPNLGPALGVTDGPPTLHDVLAGEAEAPAAVRTTDRGLSVVPGSRDLDDFSRGDPDGLDEAVAALAADHEYVFLDAGAGLSTDTLAPLRAADEAVLVSTAARDALADAARTREAAARVDRPVAGAVLTRADDADVADRLGCPVLGAVPTDPAVETATEAGVALRDHAAGSPADRAYRAVAEALTGRPVAEPSVTPRPAAAGRETAETDGGAAAGGLLGWLRGLV
jgi:septum site-determining protein MinD